MMKNITLKLKHFVLLFILAMFSVTASAVNVTYSLTTHVDGRIITGSKNLAAGVNLLENMPQDLWRGYTTYMFYSDAALTQKITTAPEEDATVYVDYVFDPPFLMSNDSKTVWNYLRNFNGGGTTNRYVYYNKTRKRIDSQDNTSVNSNKKIQWAFYGDGYSFNIKLNDSSIADPWLVWSTQATGNFINGYYYYLTLGAKPSVGWQIYANAATNYKRPGGTVSFGRPDNKDLAYLDDGGLDMRTEAIKSDQHHFDSHNQLVANHTGSSSQATIEKNALWWYAFFASPITSVPATQDIWHVTYKIQKVDGSWYDDIVVQKSSNNLKPSFPPAGFTPSEDYAYDYFYMDAEFTEKCAEDYTMPANENTVLYLRELEFVSTPWMTLVLPYDIEDLNAHFGEGAVMVNEYSSVNAEMSEAGGETYFNCHLNFTDVQQIEAYKPYLFKAIRVNPVLLDEMYYTVEDMQEPIEIKLYDDANAANIGVSMKGVLADEGYEMPGDGLNFYFGAVKEGDNYTYNFYRRGATIPQFRCYFFVTDERTDATPIKVRFGSDSLTGISSMTADDTKVNTSVYSVDGRKLNDLDNLKKGIYIVNGRKVVK